MPILDTTVIIHLYRKNQSAHTWFRAQQTTFSIASITWLEVMRGVPNKQAQRDTLNLLNGFEIVYLTEVDQNWAMQQVQSLRFSHSININDALIASVAHRLQVMLYTHNLKDMTPMVGGLAVKPYP